VARSPLVGSLNSRQQVHARLVLRGLYRSRSRPASSHATAAVQEPIPRGASTRPQQHHFPSTIRDGFASDPARDDSRRTQAATGIPRAAQPLEWPPAIAGAMIATTNPALDAGMHTKSWVPLRGIQPASIPRVQRSVADPAPPPAIRCHHPLARAPAGPARGQNRAGHPRAPLSATTLSPVRAGAGYALGARLGAIDRVLSFEGELDEEQPGAAGGYCRAHARNPHAEARCRYHDDHGLTA
jgi:hypothetical protein